MKQKLLNLLNSALSPFGLRAMTQDQVIDLSLSYHNYLHDIVRSRQVPRHKRRGRTPTVELLTTPQVRMVRNHQLSTAALARKLGVSWPTANKLRDELC
jgi:hypothetical protein